MAHGFRSGAHGLTARLSADERGLLVRLSQDIIGLLEPEQADPGADPLEALLGGDGPVEARCAAPHHAAAREKPEGAQARRRREGDARGVVLRHQGGQEG